MPIPGIGGCKNCFSMEFKDGDEYDLIVIGAGLCGLIAARDSASLGARVKVLEASNRIGGQIWCVSHIGTRKTVALGAEWLNMLKHDTIFTEFKRYGIILDSFHHKNQYILYEGKGDKSKLDERRRILHDIKSDPIYIYAMRTINWDISFVSFKDGYFQPDSDQYDMPFVEYVQHRLQVPVSSIVYEFLLIQVYHITSGNPNTQSALGVLYVIAGFRTAENAFSVDSELLHRYPEALTTYIKALADDFINLGGEIEFEKAVVELRKEEIPLPICKIPNYDYPPLPDKKRIVHVKCTTKEKILARSVIVAVPLKCLSTIRFDPPLPLAIQQAAGKCNAGVEQMKMYVFAAGISSDIGRLSTTQCECKESYIIAKHFKHNSFALSSAGGITASQVLAAAEASSKNQIPRRTLMVKYNHEMRPKSASDEDKFNHTLVCTNGSRYDLMFNLARNLRKIYPVIELMSDKQPNTHSPSRPTSRSQLNENNHQRITNINSSTSKVFSPSADSFRPLHKGIGEFERESIADFNFSESPEDVNTSEYTISHDGAVLFHDFLTDVCIRGTWFNLRAGTAHLHVLASRAARMPWHSNNRVSVYASSTLVNGAKAPIRTFVDQNKEENYNNNLPHTSTSSNVHSTISATHTEDLSLIIAGGELHPEWTGWLEGAALSGTLAAKRVYPYLFPPMVARNFARRLVLNSPTQKDHPNHQLGSEKQQIGSGQNVVSAVKGSLGSPKFSPTLDRRRDRSRVVF